MLGKTYSNIELFYKTCRTFLEIHEAENNLIFGILESLLVDPQRYDSETPPEMTIIFDKEKIVLVGLRTPPYNQILSYTNNLSAISCLVEFLYNKKVVLPGVLGFKEGARIFTDSWTKRTGTTTNITMNERIYKLKKVNPDTIGSNEVEIATEIDLPRIIPFAEGFVEEIYSKYPPDYVKKQKKMIAGRMENWTKNRTISILKVNDEIVSIVKSSKGTPKGKRINMAYTSPMFRCKGYASELVASVCQSILNEGFKYCFLFTDLSNPTSNKIYMNIGFKPVIDVDEYQFR